MSAKEYTTYLKVFSGPHIGAEIELRSGKYLIGTDNNCDIILNDGTLDLKHLQLIVNDKGVIAKPLKNKHIYVDGHIVNNESPVRVSDYSLIKVGTTHIALGSDNSQWSKVKLIKSSNTTLFEKDNDEKESVFKNYPVIMRLLLALNVAVKPIVIGGQSVRYSFCRSSYYCLYYKNKGASLFVLLGVIAIIALCVFNVSYSNYKKNQVRSVNAKASLHSYIASYKKDELKIKENKDNNISINGYVENIEELNEVEKQINNISKRIQKTKLNINLYVVDEMKEKIGQLLYLNNIQSVDLTYLGRGAFSASGFHNNKSDWGKIQNILLTDVSGLKKIDSLKIQDNEIRIKQIRRLLERVGLIDKIAIEDDKHTVILKGICSSYEIEKLHKVIYEFNKNNKNTPKILLKILNSKEVLDMDIRSVRVGGAAYMVMHDGSKYLRGSLLPNGYILTDIQPDKLLLKKNRLQVEYPIF